MREEGDAYRRSLAAGAEQATGDRVVGIAQEPADANRRIEASVSGAADRRCVPALDITATMASETGETVGPSGMPCV